MHLKSYKKQTIHRTLNPINMIHLTLLQSKYIQYTWTNVKKNGVASKSDIACPSVSRHAQHLLIEILSHSYHKLWHIYQFRWINRWVFEHSNNNHFVLWLMKMWAIQSVKLIKGIASMLVNLRVKIDHWMRFEFSLFTPWNEFGFFFRS